MRLRMFLAALILAAGALLATAESAHACIIIGQLSIPFGDPRSYCLYGPN